MLELAQHKDRAESVLQLAGQAEMLRKAVSMLERIISDARGQVGEHSWMGVSWAVQRILVQLPPRSYFARGLTWSPATFLSCSKWVKKSEPTCINTLYLGRKTAYSRDDGWLLGMG